MAHLLKQTRQINPSHLVNQRPKRGTYRHVQGRPGSRLFDRPGDLLGSCIASARTLYEVADLHAAWEALSEIPSITLDRSCRSSPISLISTVFRRSRTVCRVGRIQTRPRARLRSRQPSSPEHSPDAYLLDGAISDRNHRSSVWLMPVRPRCPRLVPTYLSRA